MCCNRRDVFCCNRRDVFCCNGRDVFYSNRRRDLIPRWKVTFHRGNKAPRVHRRCSEELSDTWRRPIPWWKVTFHREIKWIPWWKVTFHREIKWSFSPPTPSCWPASRQCHGLGPAWPGVVGTQDLCAQQNPTELGSAPVPPVGVSLGL